MSKKIMKRSLALGALMAFVITGSAYAETLSGDFGTITGSGDKTYTDDAASATIMGKGEITGFDNLVIESTFGNAIGRPGISSDDGEITINANNVTLKANEAIANSNPNGNAITAYNNLNITAKDDLTLLGNNRIVRVAAGTTTLNATNIYMNANEDGIVTNNLNDDAAIKVDGGAKLSVNSIGNLFLNAKGTNAVLAEGDGTEITLDGGESTKITGRILALGNTLKGDNAKSYDNGIEETIRVNVLGKNIVIDADGQHALRVKSDYNGGDSTVIMVGDKDTEKVTIENASYGIYSQYYGSKVEVMGTKLDITSNNVGVFAGNNDKVAINGNADTVANVQIKSNNAKITATNTGIWALSHGIVSIENGLELTAENAIVTRGAAKVDIKGNGDVKILGDIVFNNTGVSDNSKTDINEADPLGRADDEHVGVNADVNINLTTDSSLLKGSIYTSDGNGERADSIAQHVKGMKLGLSNGATWNVTDNSFVNTLNGDGGRMELATLETDDGKRLAEVKIGQNNATNLTIYGDETLTKDIENGEVKQDDALGYIAGAVEGANKNTTVAIAEGEIIGEITASVGADGEVVADSVKEAVNPVNKSIGEASVVGMAHIRAHMNDMNKRMGELRMANGEAGIWTRMVRGEEEFAGAKSQYNQYQLGYDEKLSVDKRWTVGAAVTFAEGNGNFANGSTENDSTAFAIYGSKLNNDGTFVDLIARYARFESDITVADAKSDYSTNGMSVSAEFGKRIQQGNGLWIEPQFELTYGSVDSAEYKLGDKIVQVGDMDSLIGRVGFSLGKDIKQGNVYARASYLYDFDGETETTFGNGSSVTRTIEEDLGGGWWEVGVGANINLSKATYIYADVEKTFGGEVDTNWKWNLGVRYSF